MAAPKEPPHDPRKLLRQRFVSKADLARSARKYARNRGRIGTIVAEGTGQMPKVYRGVSEANPSLSANEVRRISHEANVRTHQGTHLGHRGDPLKNAASAKRKALKLGYKANEALKGGAGVTKETVGALRRSVIAMGKFAAKGASAGMPGELVTEGQKMVDEGMKKVAARRAERRKRVSTVRASR